MCWRNDLSPYRLIAYRLKVHRNLLIGGVIDSVGGFASDGVSESRSEGVVGYNRVVLMTVGTE